MFFEAGAWMERDIEGDAGTGSGAGISEGLDDRNEVPTCVSPRIRSAMARRTSSQETPTGGCVEHECGCMLFGGGSDRKQWRAGTAEQA